MFSWEETIDTIQESKVFDYFNKENENEFFGTFYANDERKARFKIHVKRKKDILNFWLTYPNMDIIEGNIKSHESILGAMIDLREGMDSLFRNNKYNVTYRSTGINFWCIDDHVPVLFNEIIGVIDDKYNIFERLPSFRTAIFYIVLKSDENWNERLTRFMDEVVPKEDTYNIASHRDDGKGNVKTIIKEVNISKNIPSKNWDSAFTMIDNVDKITFTVYKYDDSKMDFMTIAYNLLLLLYHYAGFEITNKKRILYDITSTVIRNLVERKVLSEEWLKLL